MALYVRHVHDNMEQWGSMAREQHNLGNKNGIFSKKKAFRRTSRYVSLIFFHPLDVCLYCGVCGCVYVKSHLNHLFYFWLFYSSHLTIQLDFFFTSRITNKKKAFSRLSFSLSLSRLLYLFVQGKSSGKLFFLHDCTASSPRTNEKMRWWERKVQRIIRRGEW